MPSPVRLPIQHGFTLVELVLVILVLGIAAVAVTSLSTQTSTASARLLRAQQKLMLANSLLNEVRQMPFTYCDPNDPAYQSANGAPPNYGCSNAATVERLGPEAGESRYTTAGVNRFDNVNDYQGFRMPGGTCAGICDVNGTRLDGATGAFPSLTGCSASITTQPLAAALSGVPALDATGRPNMLRISVQVVCPDDRAPTALEGIKLRYAPNRL